MFDFLSNRWRYIGEIDLRVRSLSMPFGIKRHLLDKRKNESDSVPLCAIAEMRTMTLSTDDAMDQSAFSFEVSSTF